MSWHVSQPSEALRSRMKGLTKHCRRERLTRAMLHVFHICNSRRLKLALRTPSGLDVRHVGTRTLPTSSSISTCFDRNSPLSLKFAKIALSPTVECSGGDTSHNMVPYHIRCVRMRNVHETACRVPISHQVPAMFSYCIKWPAMFPYHGRWLKI